MMMLSSVPFVLTMLSGSHVEAASSILRGSVLSSSSISFQANRPFSSPAFISSIISMRATQQHRSDTPPSPYTPLFTTLSNHSPLAKQLIQTCTTRIHMTSSSSEQNIAPKKEGVDITIEYCSTCRWMLRSSWIASELLTTFADDSNLVSVSMKPSLPGSAGGIFRVSSSSSEEVNDDGSSNAVLWDRKVEGRFPEAKEMKQLVRDCVDPEKDLGHSDRDEQTAMNVDAGADKKGEDCIECKEEEKRAKETSQQTSNAEKETTDISVPPSFYENNQVSIEYSTGESIESSDNGLYSAVYYTNELLSMTYARNSWWKTVVAGENADATAPAAVDGVTLIPNRLETGILRVKLNDVVILYEEPPADDDASTTIMDGTSLRGIVKEVLNGKDPSDAVKVGKKEEIVVEMMDDDEAEEMRQHFGVF